MFVDRAVIHVYGGSGGSGSDAMRREKGVPRGGPAGGDGGKGGSVIIVADSQLSTLLDFHMKQHYRAERGLHGSGKNKTGKSGKDLEVIVSPGTIIRDAETKEVLGEVLKSGDRVTVAKGGRGGRGNTNFASSTNQAPTRWEPGEPGIERRLELELKLIADVGLVGEPNAGKSTLLGAISKARPKVAGYPFTTLEPNLGIVQLSDYRSFAVADIPGIIEGAHEGRGLGLRFLRHIERTRVLAFLIPVDSDKPKQIYRLLRKEIANYSEELSRRPHCVVLTKKDVGTFKGEPSNLDFPEAWAVFKLSSINRQGIKPFLESIWLKTQESVKSEENSKKEDFWEF